MKNDQGEPYCFEIIDTMGLEETKGIEKDDIIEALKGHILDGYTVSTNYGAFNLLYLLPLPV